MPIPLNDPGWFPLLAGFALLVVGLPLSTPALFALLVARAAQAGVPWWSAAAFAAVTAAASHLAAFGIARGVGPPTLRALGRRWRLFARFRSRLAVLAGDRTGWWSLLFLRWAGPGYAQAFWLLSGALSSRARALAFLAFTIATDFLWAAAWTYALVALRRGAPLAADLLLRAAVPLTVLSLGVGTWSLLRGAQRA